MKISKDCKIIKDLLPSYIDKLTSDETNIFIEDHLKECNSCTESFENMSSNNEDNENNSLSRKKVKIFKKINHKMRILQAIIILIVLIFFAITIRKYLILNHIETMAANTDYNNYSVKIVETTDKVTNIIDYYQNSNNFFKIQTKITMDNNIEKYIEYKFKDKSDFWFEIDGKKMVNEVKKDVEPFVQYQFLNKSFLGNIGLALFPNTLEETSLYKKDCYLLKVDNYFNFIDKETGLTIKEINIDNNMVVNYSYSFGLVTDEMLQELITQSSNK